MAAVPAINRSCSQPFNRLSRYVIGQHDLVWSAEAVINENS